MLITSKKPIFLKTISETIHGCLKIIWIEIYYPFISIPFKKVINNDYVRNIVASSCLHVENIDLCFIDKILNIKKLRLSTTLYYLQKMGLRELYSNQRFPEKNKKKVDSKILSDSYEKTLMILNMYENKLTDLENEIDKLILIRKSKKINKTYWNILENSKI